MCTQPTLGRGGGGVAEAQTLKLDFMARKVKESKNSSSDTYFHFI